MPKVDYSPHGRQAGAPSISMCAKDRRQCYLRVVTSGILRETTPHHRDGSFPLLPPQDDPNEHRLLPPRILSADPRFWELKFHGMSNSSQCSAHTPLSQASTKNHLPEYPDDNTLRLISSRPAEGPVRRMADRVDPLRRTGQLQDRSQANQVENRVDILDGERGASWAHSSFSY